MLGRSASNTLARDRPTPIAPWKAPAAPRDIRRNSQITKISGAKMIRKYKMIDPSAGDDGLAVTVTWSACSWLPSWVVGEPGISVVYGFPLRSVPLAEVLLPLDDDSNVTFLILCWFA